MATMYGADHYSDDYEELLNRSDVDAVSICTPPSTHYTLVMDACRKGKHVLCEKPLALSMEEANQILDVSKKSGVVLAVGHQLRFMPNVRRTRELLMKNVLGRILTCYGAFSGGSVFFSWKTASQYYKEPRSGVDVLLNYGTHVLDLFNFLFGKPISVCALLGQSTIQDVTLNDKAIVAVEYGEAFCVMNTFYTRSATADDNLVKVNGFGGTLTFWLDDPRMAFYKRDSIVSKIRGERHFRVGKRVDYLYPYLLEIRDFIESISHHRVPCVTGEDGRAALELALAARRSYETRQLVSLPLDQQTIHSTLSDR